MLLSPGSPVLKVVKHVVIKSAPDLMWSNFKGADSFICGNCGQSMWSVSRGFRHLRLLYCTSLKGICQEVSRLNIWVAVVKEKGEQRNCTLRFYADARFNKMKKVTVPNIIC